MADVEEISFDTDDFVQAVFDVGDFRQVNDGHPIKCYICGKTDYLWYLTDNKKTTLFYAVRRSMNKNNSAERVTMWKGETRGVLGCSAECYNSYIEKNRADVLIELIKESYLIPWEDSTGIIANLAYYAS
jgi:hypothetical protein